MALDPPDWDAFRALGHRMIDDMVDYLRDVRKRPTWQPISPEARSRLDLPLPLTGASVEDIYADFRKDILPFATGNTHPGFVGWVHGTGTPTGMLAELLAAGMNSNCGGRDHAGIYVERQVVRWCAELFGFPPEEASGVLVAGSSQANLLAVVVARTAHAGVAVRSEGIRRPGCRDLAVYASRAAHGCIAKALDVTGLGSAALRSIPLGADGRMDLAVLRATVARDRAAGAQPFLIVATAGSVDTGAIDDLNGAADLAAAEGLWLHVDGAFGALAATSPELRPRLAGLERADSIALDFHKCGCCSMGSDACTVIAHRCLPVSCRGSRTV